MPLPLIPLILGSALGAGAVVAKSIISQSSEISCADDMFSNKPNTLEYATIKEWFRENTYVDKDNVRALFQQVLDNGDYNVVQCGFNRKAKELTAVKSWRAEDRDQELIDKGPATIITEEC